MTGSIRSAGGRERALADIAEIANRHRLGVADIQAALGRAADAPASSGRAAGVLSRVMAYLGGILVLAGIALVVGLQWDQLGGAARVLLTLGSGFAIYLVAVTTMVDERFARATAPLLLVAALLQPTGLVVMLEEFMPSVQAEHGGLFVCVIMFIQQFLTFLARPRTPLLFMSLLFGAAAFGIFSDIIGIDVEWVGVALGAALVAIANGLERTPHLAIAPFWYFIGAVLGLSGSFGLLEGSAAEPVFFGIAAAVMYLGAVVRSRVLLLVSVIALTAFTGYFFQDSLMNAFGLIVLGMLLIGLSALALRLDRRFIRR